MADCCGGEARNARERRLLWTVLVLNAVMFLVEFVAGWVAQSSGLLADSLDMLADSAVYGLSLYAVGHTAVRKARAAMVNGSLQLTLGVIILADVARRMVFGSAPDAVAIGGIATLALVVNVACFLLLYSSRKGEVNMRASWICSRNDMIANVGVLASAGLVAWLNTPWPDWLIGAAIAALIIHSALGIIRDARESLRQGAAPSACCAGD